MNERKVSVLIVDDDKEFVNISRQMLEHLGDVHFEVGHTETDFYDLYKPGKFNAIILDLRLKTGHEGMGLLEFALNEDPEAPIVVLTSYASIESAIKALKLGAKDYLQKEYLEEKPFLSMISNVIIKDKARKLALERDSSSEEDLQLIGDDINIQRIAKLARFFSETKESPILLVGEEGTEKELIAQYIYKNSGAHGKFIKKILQPNMEGIENELFGTENSPGLILEARGGVLYLEEIFSLDINCQDRLLDFFNSGQLKKVNEEKGQLVKTQIILSTSQFPEQIKKNRQYNSAFFYRVKTAEISIPPLRERGNDILLLAQFYLNMLNKSGKGYANSISEDFLQIIKTYPWPGNIWELQNIIERASMNARLDKSRVINLQHLPGDLQDVSIGEGTTVPLNLDKILAETTLKYMSLALKKSKGAKLEAYQYLGYPESKRGTLNTRIKKIFLSYPELVSKYSDVYQLYKERKG